MKKKEFLIFELFLLYRNLQKPFVRKTLEELQYEYITSLIEDRDFHQPTISYLAKCNQIKLPIICDKCLEAITSRNDDYETDGENYYYPNNDLAVCTHVNEEETLKPVVGNYLSYLSPCGTCEYNKKLCILYNSRKSASSSSYVETANGSPSPSLLLKRNPPDLRSNLQSSLSMKSNTKSDYYTRPTKHVKIANPPERPQTATSTQSSKQMSASRLSSSSSTKQNYTSLNSATITKKSEKKVQGTQDPPMIEGDIRYKFTKSGLEVKRLNSKNSLILDIFTPDVCKDNSDKSYSEWINRQKEDEDRKQQKFPSKIYEKQLEEALRNFKKGPLTYETWARQNYEILLLKDKIKKAKKLESVDKIKKKEEAKKQESLNAFQMWKIGKDFARYAATDNIRLSRNP